MVSGSNFHCLWEKGYGEIPSRFLSWYGNCEGDPLSPPEGGSPGGASPPHTQERFDFSPAGEIHGHAPQGEPRRGGECPWPRRYPIPVPFFGFLTGMISLEPEKGQIIVFRSTVLLRVWNRLIQKYTPCQYRHPTLRFRNSPAARFRL
jgi:hypothetical protein